MTCPLFAHSLYKISEIQISTKPFAVCMIPNHSHQCNHLRRDVSTIPIEQQASDLRKPSRSIKTAFDFVGHGEVDPTFHGNHLVFHCITRLRVILGAVHAVTGVDSHSNQIDRFSQSSSTRSFAGLYSHTKLFVLFSRKLARNKQDKKKMNPA